MQYLHVECWFKGWCLDGSKINNKKKNQSLSIINTFIRYLQNSLLTNEVKFSNDWTQNQYKNLFVTWTSDLFIP